MPEETKDLAWALPVAVQLILPIVLVILTGAGTWMVAKIRAKNERIKQEQDHALAITAQQADFDGRKKAAAMARDKLLFDQQQLIITQLQEDRKAAEQREARQDRKLDEVYGLLGYEREHTLEWEEWYRDGMPNPPGKPKRRHIATPELTATPTGG
ncbi:hypothetical protein [Arthrobacter sp. GMC3]|uniref:hypothetical protein n=1 Tax=Arthrobacter sp. GMC3 TaxID=2058894 RepID=UPI000CE44C21|nr:hypothetical protein [Arthrobacter sp. GMC3]